MDYAQLVKMYGEPSGPKTSERRYSADPDLIRPPFRFEAGHFLRSERTTWVSNCGITVLASNEENVMPAQRKLTMRQLRQMLRLASVGTSSRDIALMLGVARSTIQDNLKRANAAGVTWPLPGELTDGALQEKLFHRAGFKPGMRRRTEPDWASLAVEMKRPGVTLLILWEEYRAIHPDGYGYSRFCELLDRKSTRLNSSHT